MAIMKVREVGNFIRDQRRTASLSLRKLSTLAGVSNPYLSQIERGLRRPSAEILKEIARALSISAETLYIKAGILDERTDDVDVIGTLRRDETISEKQRQLLTDMYQSFKTPAPATARTPSAAKRPAKPAGKTPAKSSAKSASASKPAGKRTPPAKSAAKPRKAASGKPAARTPSKKTGTASKTKAKKKAARRTTGG